MPAMRGRRIPRHSAKGRIPDELEHRVPGDEDDTQDYGPILIPCNHPQEIMRLEADRRALRDQLNTLESSYRRWRDRANDMRARLEMAQEESKRLRDDNVRLSNKLVELATMPREQLDVTGILAEFRKTVSPEVRVVNDQPDSPQNQRVGVNWTDQGLDNNAGVPENYLPALEEEEEKASIPDYVLDIERLDPQMMKGTRGGWYNPLPHDPRMSK